VQHMHGQMFLMTKWVQLCYLHHHRLARLRPSGWPFDPPL